MEWLKVISDICSDLSIIGTLLAVAFKGAAYLRRMNEKIDRLEGYSHNDYMNTLKLTIMTVSYTHLLFISPPLPAGILCLESRQPLQ